MRIIERGVGNGFSNVESANSIIQMLHDLAPLENFYTITFLRPPVLSTLVLQLSIMKTAVIVSDESREDEVGINNTVKIYFEDEDETEEFKLVTSIRGNSLKGMISTESPIGKAILGHETGERVLVKINEETGYYVVIREIQNTRDDSADKIRGF